MRRTNPINVKDYNVVLFVANAEMLELRPVWRSHGGDHFEPRPWGFDIEQAGSPVWTEGRSRMAKCQGCVNCGQRISLSIRRGCASVAGAKKCRPLKWLK